MTNDVFFVVETIRQTRPNATTFLALHTARKARNTVLWCIYVATDATATASARYTGTATKCDACAAMGN